MVSGRLTSLLSTGASPAQAESPDLEGQAHGPFGRCDRGPWESGDVFRSLGNWRRNHGKPWENEADTFLGSVWAVIWGVSHTFSDSVWIHRGWFKGENWWTWTWVLYLYSFMLNSEIMFSHVLTYPTYLWFQTYPGDLNISVKKTHVHSGRKFLEESGTWEHRQIWDLSQATWFWSVKQMDIDQQKVGSAQPAHNSTTTKEWLPTWYSVIVEPSVMQHVWTKGNIPRSSRREDLVNIWIWFRPLRL